MKIWDTFMFNGEFDMLQCRLEQYGGYDVTAVLVEARVTHRGQQRPIYWDSVTARRFRGYDIRHVVADLKPGDPNDRAKAWGREHRQRDAAWSVLAEEAGDDDIVLLCDVDEIPNLRSILDPGWLGGTPGALWRQFASVYMKTYLAAVDWKVVTPVPPTCVIARVGLLRTVRGEFGLGQVRDGRDWYLALGDGGWHFSWVGGPDFAAAKLDTTCHLEMLTSPEADLIRSGDRYALGASVDGLKVEPVDVDDSYPAFIRERRCPDIWFRPQS